VTGHNRPAGARDAGARDAGARGAGPRPYGTGAAEGATFEATRLGGPRRRPPVFVLAFAALLTGVIAIGISGRTPAAAPAVLGSPVAQGSAAPTGAPGSPGREGPPVGPRFSPDQAPIVSTTDGPIQLLVRRHPETMFVHGDVFVDRVTWVFVSLQNAAGRVAGWASVSVPGAAGPGNDGGPTLRFDLELAVPSDFVDGPIWIQAYAYDSQGRVVASARLGTNPDGGPQAERAPSGAGQPIGAARPGVFFPLLDASWEDVR
jgi:hypothetical protein